MFQEAGNEKILQSAANLVKKRQEQGKGNLLGGHWVRDGMRTAVDILVCGGQNQHGWTCLGEKGVCSAEEEDRGTK